MLLLDRLCTFLSLVYSFYNSKNSNTYMFYIFTEPENEIEEEDEHFDSVEPLTKSQLEARKISGSTYSLSFSYQTLSLSPPPSPPLNISFINVYVLYIYIYILRTCLLIHSETNKKQKLIPLTSSAGEIKYDNGMIMNYAYLTQRGYYPDQPDKANQDNYQVVEKFCDMNNRVRFFCLLRERERSISRSNSQYTIHCTVLFWSL